MPAEVVQETLPCGCLASTPDSPTLVMTPHIPDCPTFIWARETALAEGIPFEAREPEVTEPDAS